MVNKITKMKNVNCIETIQSIIIQTVCQNQFMIDYKQKICFSLTNFMNYISF